MTKDTENQNTSDTQTSTENQNTSDTQTSTENQGTTGHDSTDLQAPGGNPDNRETVQNMDAPELRTAVIELLTIIDDSDDLDVVVTISDDGTVLVAAA